MSQLSHEHAASARLSGESFDPERHERGHEVKAVTHHELTIEQSERGFVARVLLDI